MGIRDSSVTLDDGAKGVVAVEVRNCVYRELADEYPDVVCPFDRGTVCGMLGVDASAHTQTHSMSAGDDYCRHEFRLVAGPAGAAPPASVSLRSPASPVP